MEEMKPGRELDALIAEKVMGLNVQSSPETSGGDGSPGNRMLIGSKPVYYDEPRGSIVRGFGKDIPPYSTSIAAAWEVVEKLDLFSKFYLHKIPKGEWAGMNGYYKIQSYEMDKMGSLGEWSHFTFAEGETAPHAICKAALAAVGVKDGN